MDDYAFWTGLNSVSDEHDQMQKKTFTKWVNYHLETHNSSELVDDLFEDLRDGVLLCHLIEVLTGEALPVNKAKESKRVHHISNLTTALAVLRRRGLDLVNNNPADIANGNPRIICGLIWQIILHFQIETNVQLLKEWGFELELAGSPSTSRIGNGNSPFGKLPYQLRVGRLKAPVDRVVLRWVNAQLARPYNINLTDMDKSWRDGIAFNALIHRIRPELVDMDVVHRNTPKANLEQAFRLAKEHLHIRPLLDVEDMLCDKSDKRSVITYVSQFIRTLKHVRPIATCPMIDDRSLISWMEDTLSILRSSVGAPLYDQYQTYLSLRKQYFEQRNAYYSLRDAALPKSEWNQIETSWKRIGDLLEDWSHNLECELPEKLSGLAQWLCTAEQMIQNPVDIRVDDAQLSLSNINESISHHKIHFSEFPYRSERFQSIYLSRRVDEREVAVELLEPLKIRFNNLATAAPRRLQYLHRMQAHYQLLSNIEVLNQKMERWKSGDSAAAVQKSMKEYKMEAESAPAKKFKRLLTHLKEVCSEASLEETDCVIKQCEDASSETMEKFKQLKPHLDELFKFWSEFENTAIKIEERITRSEREKRNLIDENDKELLRHCERIHDDIARFGNDQVQQIVNNRLSELRKRISAVKRKIPPKAASHVQGNLLSEKLARMKSTLPGGENIAASDTYDPGHSRLQKWLITARQQISTVVTDFCSLEHADCLREVQEVENERMALLKTRGANSEQNIGEYRKLRSDLQTLLQHMKNVQPLFLSFEKNHDNLLNWLKDQDTKRGNEENQMFDIITHMEFLLETLLRNEYKQWINCDFLQHRLDELKHKMKKRKEQFAEAEESSRIATRTAVLTKKKKLLEQTKAGKTLKFGSTVSLKLTLIWNSFSLRQTRLPTPISDEFNSEKEKLQEKWHQKTEAISQLKIIHDAIGVLRNKLAANPRLSELILLSAELDSLSQQCMNVVDSSIIGFRNCYLKEIEEELRTAITELFSRAERRVIELSVVGETDVRLAVDILQVCYVFVMCMCICGG
uniref:Calponin-homology (CH) domain-containing protein n=1 Tax=Elaeophora elaphi TaxID=1147741 RepID=A0A158Q8X7_9BILA